MADNFVKEFELLGAPYSEAVEVGLRALKDEHRKKVHIADPRRLSGSIDIDTVLARDRVHGREPRWDYGIGFRLSEGTKDYAVWVEVHDADASAVSDMLKKLGWLKDWLRTSSANLEALTRATSDETGVAAYTWLATGRVNLTRTSRWAKQIAKEGLSFPSRELRLP